MKWLIPLFMAVVACKAISLMELQLVEWEEFKIKHGKRYETFENDFRMQIYLQNKLKIEKHNLAYEKGIYSYKLGMNQFGDLLPHEAHKITHCLKNVTERAKNLDRATFITPANIDLPAEIDWRKKGAVTGVKDQGRCGSCWAFSAIGSLEGQHFRKTGVLTSLSEQNLVDCSRKYGNEGCSGGRMDNAFQYIKDNGGIDTESSYPYEAMNDDCRYNASTSGATDIGLVDIDKWDETKLMEAVATVGPISVAIEVTDNFQRYHGGVFYDESCSGEQLNHGVTVVGYGTENGLDYWLVKNSWGADWGEEGYIKMARNKNNNCGIASAASYPLV
ncbi:Cathepsin L [Blattella germanica]|nr:Cathepsin L [Blattella germanica]